MNRLENEYFDQVEFRDLDANNGEGKLAFQAYQLRGHPGYVILNIDGQVLWIGVGEQTEGQIKTQLNTALGQ